MYKISIANETAMTDLGQQLAKVMPSSCVIYFVGELGAGKTTLIRGLIQALGHRGTVKSPTYTLVEPYELTDHNIYHLDLYRLSDPEELEFLGMRDWLENNAILLVEWPQKGGSVLPQADIVISIEYAGQGRLLTLAAVSEKGTQIATQLGVAS